MQEKYRVLFEPGRIAGVPLKNRFYMAPIGPSGMCDAEGAFTETAVEYYAVRARGGVGLIITGEKTIEQVGEEAFAKILRLLEGEMTKNEAIQYFSSIDIHCLGPVI